MQYRQFLAGSAMVALVAAGPIAKRDPNATVTGNAATTTINNQDGIGAGNNANTFYRGDGSTGAGWPAKSAWVSFEDMFNNNKDAMRQSCNGQVGLDGQQVPLNSEDEIGQIYDSIQQVAQASAVDHRVILAMIMQESHGCVRVETSAFSVNNPGLMQDYNGQYTCNDSKNTMGGAVLNPCPAEQITGMISEGSRGTAAGPGMAEDINVAQNQYGCTDAQCFYQGARIYNSGSIPASGDLSDGGSTASYASDIANRLTGWVN